jgi:hypothetical protein
MELSKFETGYLRNDLVFHQHLFKAPVHCLGFRSRV